MRKPNFFIVGAPRCGTTAMYEYLKAHPDIFMPSFKEPHYFGADVMGGRKEIFKGNESKYLALFADATTEKRLGEASPSYLYSKCAAAEIKQFNPDSKIIIMLRSPIEVMYSTYYQARYTGTEDLPTFEEALAAEPDRRAGRRISKNADNNMVGLYRDRVRFAEQVQRYFDVFGREEVHVIIFDDFKKGLPTVYRDALTFLDVAPDFRPEFNVVNASRKARSSFIRTLSMNPTLLSIGKRVPSVSLRVYSFLKHLNSKTASRSTLAPELRHRLQQDLQPEIEMLGEMLGRDLSAWYQV
jgi:hypothetical protein